MFLTLIVFGAVHAVDFVDFKRSWKAKQDKDWATADRLRDEVLEAGWEIKDTKEGYELCSKN